MSNENQIARLRNVLQKPDTVLLIGSGVSLWSGLPTWGGLIHELATYVTSLGRDAGAISKELNGGDLLLAASYGVFELSQSEFSSFIRKFCGSESFKPAEIHRLLIELGPTSFVTTNYDTLIEDAADNNFVSRAGRRLQVVNNRNFVEIGQIIQSSSRDFIFKYHGDIRDSESIILTREQYQSLKSKFRIVNDALTVLLATRPVVMIGFGLRDPDFLSIKDDLMAAFSGPVGEHFAIMPDFTTQETDYWRKQYGIEVVSYATKKLDDGRSDHSALLSLLGSLQTRELAVKPISPPIDWKTLLSRVAGRYLARNRTTDEKIFPLRATVRKNQTTVWEGSVEQIFSEYNRNIIIGGPGSGKSFLLKRRAAQLARDLLEACWSAEAIERPVPILADLRQYNGDLRTLLEAQLPESLSLELLVKSRECIFLLDGANEMPEFLVESGAFQEDLAKLLHFAPNAQITVTGRDGGWWTNIDFSISELQAVDQKWVREYLNGDAGKDNIINRDILEILETPLLLSLVTAKNISTDNIKTPADIHERVFAQIDRSWNLVTSSSVNFSRLLAPLAFALLDNGVEYFSHEDIDFHLANNLCTTDGSSQKVLEFLISENILHVLPQHRIAFFHQTATEYLAAMALATQREGNLDQILSRLTYRRWDQAVFVAIRLLAGDRATELFDRLASIDLVAALRAVQYVTVEQSAIIGSLLQRLLDTKPSESLASAIGFTHTIAHQLQSVPLGSEHEKLLVELANKRNDLGAAAAKELMRLNPGHRGYFLAELVNGIGTYGYMTGLGRALAGDATPEEVEAVLVRLPTKTTLSDGHSSAIEKFASQLPSNDIFVLTQRCFLLSSNGKAILATICAEHYEQWSYDFVVDCLIEGTKDVTYPLYRIIRRRPAEKMILPSKLDALSSALFSILTDQDSGRWAIEVINLLAGRNPDFTTFLLDAASRGSETLYLLCQAAVNSDSIKRYVFLQEVMSDLPTWTEAELELLSANFFWEDAPGDFLRKVFSFKNSKLIGRILTSFSINSKSPSEIATAAWWYDFLEEYVQCDTPDNFVMLSNLTNWIVMDEEFCDLALAKFNEATDKSFSFMARNIIDKMTGVSVDMLSSPAINRLLTSDFGIRNRFGQSILGSLATEVFVQEELLPRFLAAKEDSVERIELAHALYAAGQKHNRRYLLTAEDVALLSADKDKRTPHRQNKEWSLKLGD
ncbi:SIR2 family protein [Trinickia sp. YCB016]